MTDAMSELTPAFERVTGHKVLVTFEPTNLILERLRQGKTADVVILVKPTLQKLKQTNKIVAGTEAGRSRNCGSDNERTAADTRDRGRRSLAGRTEL